MTIYTWISIGDYVQKNVCRRALKGTSKIYVQLLKTKKIRFFGNISIEERQLGILIIDKNEEMQILAVTMTGDARLNKRDLEISRNTKRLRIRWREC